jgi:hypothetical protein
MSTEEEQQEIMFSSVLLNQRKKVEKECKKLQALIDREVSESTFMWLPNSNHVNIVDDIFKKSKRIREPEPEDDDSSESEEQEDNVPANSLVPQIFMKKIWKKENYHPRKCCS